MTMEERFWNKVLKRADNECWEWLAQKTSLGYGVFWLNGKNNKAHRVAWTLMNGAIPDGLVVRHKCRGKCVNPNHMELGTMKDNQIDRVRDGTTNRGERHGMSKLTEDQVRQIKKIQNRSIGDIAKDYNVSRRTIGMIKDGIRWQWIE